MKRINPIAVLVALHLLMVALAAGLLVRHKGQPPEGKEKIIVLSIDGIITMENRFVAGGQSIDAFVQTMKQYEEDDDLKAVLLRINSPGGSIGAVQEVHRALVKLRSKGKIIVSSFADVAASGGYYIACAGDKIVANPGTITGSIGVIMQMSNVQGLLEKIGVSFETIKSGDFKDAGSPFRKMSDIERAHFQTLILDAYDQFFTAVKEGRKMTDDQLKQAADGRVFSGRMAAGHKLVDEVGGLDEALELTKQLAGLADKKPRIIYHRDRRPLDRLLKMLGVAPSQPWQQLVLSETKIMYLMK